MSKILLTIIFSLVFSFNLFAVDAYTANLAFSKAQKALEKEENMALAYKKYLKNYGAIPTAQNLLEFLPSGFSLVNDFGYEMKIEDQRFILDIINDQETTSIAKFYDYYYSNTNRTYTLSPASVSDSLVQILLTKFEQFILTNRANITISIENEKFHLKNGTLTYYDKNGNKLFLYNGNDVIIYEDNLVNGELTAEIQTIFDLYDIYSIGLKIYNYNGSSLDQLLYVGEGNIKLAGDIITSLYMPAKLLVTPYSGGYLLNGDIYTWGNNTNKVLTLVTNDIINFPIRLKVYNEETSYNDRKIYSHPNRVKFIDFYTNVYNGTCGVSTKSALYCSGHNATQQEYTSGSYPNEASSELLYKISYFDGTDDKKANKVIAIDKRWFVLANGTYDSQNSNYSNAELYTWGSDSDGFAGNSTEENENTSKTKININDLGLKDIAHSYEQKYKKIFALTNDGDIYLWGMDLYNSNDKCEENIDDVEMNLCEPTKINTSIKFKQIKSGFRHIIAKSTDDEYYVVFQDEDDLPKVINLKDSSNNETITDIDVLPRDKYYSDDFKTIWINDSNKLEGAIDMDNLSLSDKFKAAINANKWLKLKVVNEDSMCALTDTYQVYCWGDVKALDDDFETYTIPIANSNILNSLTSTVRNLLHDTKIENPTFIGGFNYNFIFK